MNVSVFFARVAVGHRREMADGVFVRVEFQVADAPLFVTQGALEQAEQIFLGQRTQLEDLRARDERRVDEEEWVVRGRADEPDDAAFHIR